MFGGGIFDKKRDHKEIMLDVIAKAKKYKYERQQEKEEISNTFENLDKNYSNILKMTSQFNRSDDNKVTFKCSKKNVLYFFLNVIIRF